MVCTHNVTKTNPPTNTSIHISTLTHTYRHMHMCETDTHMHTRTRPHTRTHTNQLWVVWVLLLDILSELGCCLLVQSGSNLHSVTHRSSSLTDLTN